MSATLMFRKALVRLGSGGVVSVTSGLSSVGPPPTLRISQLLAILQDDRVALQHHGGTENRLVELTGPVLVGDDQEMGHHKAVLRERGSRYCSYRKPLILWRG